MNKLIKKIATLLLAGAMVAGMSVSATAAGATKTITVPDVSGHTYEIFQIFTADVASDSTVSNVKWGKNGTGTLGADVEKTVLEALNALNVAGKSNAEKLTEIEKYVNISDNDAFKTDVAAGASVTVPTGYYLVKDKDNSQDGKNDSYTTYIVEVVKDVTMTAKMGTVTVEKKVKDVTDIDGVYTDWQDSADYDIGDAIPYKLTGTLPANFADYKTYKTYTFTDELSTGLDITAAQLAAVTVTIGEGGTSIKDYFNVSYENKKLIVSLKATSDLKTIEGIDKNSEIVVCYYATLTEAAKLGKPGNPNDVYLTYSNNPNWNGEGDEDTGDTPKDVVIVFTYKPIVNKVDEKRDALAGAGFTLYKEVKAGTADAKTGSEIKAALKAQNASIRATALKDGSSYIAIAMEPNQDGKVFSYKGIDDGTYVLVETTIPEGYNAYEAEEFKVTATHTNDGDTPPRELTALNGGDVLTGDVDAGTLTGDVTNKKGTTLPSTGGMGTTLFYVIGGILVLAAAIILVSKKRIAQ